MVSGQRASRDWLWLLWPPAWFVIFSGSKDFSAHAVLGSRVLNAAGLHVARKTLAHWLCRRRRARMRATLPPELTRQWDDSGAMRLDDFLAPADWDSVCDELCHAALPIVEMAQPPAVTRRANLDVHTCKGRYPALLQLITDERLMHLLHYAAGYRGQPVVSVQCVHSEGTAGAGGVDPQTEWHVDTFHSTAKAWLFLHAVGAGEGPLGYRPGSHALTDRRLHWERCASLGAAGHANRLHAKGSLRASDEELRDMGYGQAVEYCVPGNTLIIADTGGFHRRVPSATATVRVEVYFSLRRNPFLAGMYPSLLGWPLLRERWAGWLFILYTWLHARGTPSWIPRQTTGLNASERHALRRSDSLNSASP